jgi:hypothetical protein
MLYCEKDDLDIFCYCQIKYELSIESDKDQHGIQSSFPMMLRQADVLQRVPAHHAGSITAITLDSAFRADSSPSTRRGILVGFHKNTKLQ